MQKAELVLTKLYQKSQEDKAFVFQRLYRNLYNPHFYMRAYAKNHHKPGNLTAGTDDSTIDGFNVKQIQQLIDLLRKEQYYPIPVRRTYIPKKNGKKRPLGIPAFTDKLLQEVLKEILEAIYEPLFSNFSHGFRPGKSCHTALKQIKDICSGSIWCIEGDIKGFFDNLDHDVLLAILKQKIDDGRIEAPIRGRTASTVRRSLFFDGQLKAKLRDEV